MTTHCLFHENKQARVTFGWLRLRESSPYFRVAMQLFYETLKIALHHQQQNRSDYDVTVAPPVSAMMASPMTRTIPAVTRSIAVRMNAIAFYYCIAYQYME